MRTDRTAPLPAASLLQLMWLASPALPVGGFSYSEGLESAIENANLSTEAAVANWLLDQLHITQSRGDMALIAKAVGAWRRGDMTQVYNTPARPASCACRQSKWAGRWPTGCATSTRTTKP